MRLFLLNANGITVHECDEASALRIDAYGAPAADDTWVASIVTFVSGPRAPQRHALIARPGATVTLGPDRLVAGVAELGHGDHLLRRRRSDPRGRRATESDRRRDGRRAVRRVLHPPRQRWTYRHPRLSALWRGRVRRLLVVRSRWLLPYHRL